MLKEGASLRLHCFCAIIVFHWPFHVGEAVVFIISVSLSPLWFVGDVFRVFIEKNNNLLASY